MRVPQENKGFAALPTSGVNGFAHTAIRPLEKDGGVWTSAGRGSPQHLFWARGTVAGRPAVVPVRRSVAASTPGTDIAPGLR